MTKFKAHLIGYSILSILSFLSLHHAEAKNRVVTTASEEASRISEIFSLLSKNIESAKTADEWDSAYHNFEAFFKNPGKSSKAGQALCSHLKSLSISELQYFDGLIEARSSRNALGICQDELINKIEVARLYSRPVGYLESDLAAIKTIPFEERYIDESRDLFSNQGFAEKEVMLTFDDGPRKKTTPQILAALKKAGVKAAFFNTGVSVEDNQEQVNQILDDGHILGSHTYYHTLMMGRNLNRGAMSYDQFLGEIIGGHVAVYMGGHKISPFFRFPNGCSNSNMARNVTELGLKNFRWSVDSHDWEFSRGSFDERRTKIMKAFTDSLKASRNRGIILMHDIHQQTVDTLPLVLKYLSDNGFRIILLKPHSDTDFQGKIPVVDQAMEFLKQRGMGVEDIIPPAPHADEHGHQVLDVNYTSSVNFFDMFPQLSYKDHETSTKAGCDTY